MTTTDRARLAEEAQRLLREAIRAASNNSGAEPSLSAASRAFDEASAAILALAESPAAPSGDVPESVKSYAMAAQLAQSFQKDEAERYGDPDFEPPCPADWIVCAILESHARGYAAGRASAAKVEAVAVIDQSRVADLLHLLEFATITTPSVGDAELAQRIMTSLRASLGVIDQQEG